MLHVLFACFAFIVPQQNQKLHTTVIVWISQLQHISLGKHDMTGLSTSHKDSQITHLWLEICSVKTLVYALPFLDDHFFFFFKVEMPVQTSLFVFLVILAVKDMRRVM